MTNQDTQVLSLKLLRNLAKRWWIILIFSIVGGALSLNWRKELPQKEKIQATLFSSVNSEVFIFLTESGSHLKIGITYSGSSIMKVSAESENDVEAKFRQWVDDSNKSLEDIYGQSKELYKDQLENLKTRRNIFCRNLEKKSLEDNAKCIQIEAELINVKQQMVKETVAMKIIAIKPFAIQPTSLPLRDIIFGLFIGAFIGLVLVSAFIQIQMVNSKK
ncbi:MAG: hypothetical protein AABY53_06415 [Bdellovibrionota bacterium]